jgi:type II secretory pathway pseudopilin PulG
MTGFCFPPDVLFYKIDSSCGFDSVSCLKNPTKSEVDFKCPKMGKLHRSKGFALVVSLVLMILLTVLAVSLLSLSSISLRKTGEEDARMKAQANARMALILAIGELQKNLGPDKAISAPSDILGESPAKPGLMGVWNSWDYTEELQKTSPTLDYENQKKDRFQGWMVSTSKAGDGKSLDFAKSDWSGETIILAGAASYGGKLPTSGAIRAGKVRLIANGKQQGAYAWHVSDESIKARINLYRDPAMNSTVSQKRALLAGHRPDASMVDADLGFLDNDKDENAFKSAVVASGKISSLNQAELSGKNGIDKLKPLRDEVTPYSAGVLADVRLGGLKKDLSSLFELSSNSSVTTLPAEFSNKGLYATTH